MVIDGIDFYVEFRAWLDMNMLGARFDGRRYWLNELGGLGAVW